MYHRPAWGNSSKQEPASQSNRGLKKQGRSHLSGRLDAELERGAGSGTAHHIAATTIIVSEQTGQPYAADNFRHVFAAIRAKAAKAAGAYELDHLMPGRDMADADAFRVAMADLTFMHLRHTAITRLAEAGCDPQTIASISGHSLKTVGEILERYMVRTAEIACGAFQRRLGAAAGMHPNGNAQQEERAG